MQSTWNSSLGYTNQLSSKLNLTWKNNIQNSGYNIHVGTHIKLADILNLIFNNEIIFIEIYWG